MASIPKRIPKNSIEIPKSSKEIKKIPNKFLDRQMIPKIFQEGETKLWGRKILCNFILYLENYR